MTEYTFKRYIATFFLVLMCIQFIPIEGFGSSYLKIGSMILTPFIFLSFTPKVSKAFIMGGLYLFVIVISILINIENFRLTTVLYKFSFVVMFITYFNLVYFEKVFTLDYFIKIIKWLLHAYIFFLLLQQLAIIIGIQSLPFINLMGYLGRGIGANSLALEPSHAARIMCVLMLVLFRTYEVQWGKHNVTLKRIYRDHKWTLLGFIWAILTMGSGTAFVGFAILSLYFLQKQFAFAIAGFLLIFYFLVPSIDYAPLNRAKASFEAAQTLDSKVIIETDHSAAARIVPLINTFTNLDLEKGETWYGKGVDTNISAEYLSEEQTIGGIADYGLVSYIISFLFVMACCIKKVWSLETLIFILLLGAGIGNVAYVWGILMLFAASNYILRNEKQINISNLGI